jgi:hypothetical protein
MNETLIDLSGRRKKMILPKKKKRRKKRYSHERFAIEKKACTERERE